MEKSTLILGTFVAKSWLFKVNFQNRKLNQSRCLTDLFPIFDFSLQK